LRVLGQKAETMQIFGGSTVAPINGTQFS